MSAAYVSKGAKTQKGRVYDRDGVAHVRTFGTTDAREARAMQAFLTKLRTARRWDVLDLVIARSISIAEAYDAAAVEQLGALVARKTAEANDVDLEPKLAQWAATGANPRYVVQVRRLMPAGARFPRSGFTRARIHTFLTQLTQVPVKRAKLKKGEEPPAPRKASPSTRNRYRSALYQFARELVQLDVLDTNPVRDVAQATVPYQPPVYLAVAEQQTLIKALPGEHQVLEALMAGTSLEWGACAGLRGRDVNLQERTFHAFPWLTAARGKNKFRNRIVVCTEDWAWAYLEAHLKRVPPNARVFNLVYEAALQTHYRVSKAIGLPRTHLHHWRHSYAVEFLSRGGDAQALKRQLGHSPRSTLVYTTYGTWIVPVSEIRARSKAPAATNPATSPENQHEPA